MCRLRKRPTSDRVPPGRQRLTFQGRGTKFKERSMKIFNAVVLAIAVGAIAASPVAAQKKTVVKGKVKQTTIVGKNTNVAVGKGAKARTPHRQHRWRQQDQGQGQADHDRWQEHQRRRWQGRQGYLQHRRDPQQPESRARSSRPRSLARTPTSPSARARRPPPTSARSATAKIKGKVKQTTIVGKNTNVAVGKGANRFQRDRQHQQGRHQGQGQTDHDRWQEHQRRGWQGRQVLHRDRLDRRHEVLI